MAVFDEDSFLAKLPTFADDQLGDPISFGLLALIQANGFAESGSNAVIGLIASPAVDVNVFFDQLNGRQGL